MSAVNTLAIVLTLSQQAQPRQYSPMALPATASVVTIEHQLGGNVADHAYRVIDYDRAGTQVRIMGACVSACALVLALPADRICVGPGAVLGFHQATTQGQHVQLEGLSQAIFDSYPGFVQGWLKHNFGGLTAGTPKFMRYDILKQHYRTCS